MKRKRILPLSILLIPVISWIFMTSTTYGQQQKGADEATPKSPQAEEYDRKVLDKLKTMTPQQVEELDKKLAEALTLYYDREYARALTIFRDVSDKAETMDVAFWLASSAARAGEVDLALKKLREMLAVDPNLHRVRLELATVYFETGKYKEARQELETVLEAKPPEAVKKNIEKLLANIDAKTKRLFTSLRGSFGYQWDSNVSAGPENERIYIPPAGTGGTLTLTETQRELRHDVGVVNLFGSALYDMGEERSWMWNMTGSLYQTYTQEHQEFDFTQWRLTTGPWWVGQQSILKLLAGYTGNIFEHDRLFYSYEYSASYEYFFTSYFSLRGLWSNTKDQYVSSIREGQDNTNRILELNPSFYFNNRKDILSFIISDEMAKARDPRYSYDGTNLGVSYFKQFKWFTNWDMEFYSRYKFSKREYRAPEILWPMNHLRTDKRHNFYIVLSRNFYKNLFASLSYNWVENSSNTDLYTFDKHVVGFNVGFKF